MPAFAVATPEEVTQLTAESDAVDLAPYTVAIGQMGEQMIDANYSRWFKAALAADEKARTESKRFTAAATLAGKHVAVKTSKDKRVLWIRLRPAPVARAKRNGAVTNGATVTPPAPAAGAAKK